MSASIWAATSNLDIDHQATAVVRQHVAEVAGQRRRPHCTHGTSAPAGRSGICGDVSSWLAVPDIVRSPVIRAVLTPHALMRGHKPR